MRGATERNRRLAAAATLLGAAYLLGAAGFAIRYHGELTQGFDGGEVAHSALDALGGLLAGTGFLWSARRLRAAGFVPSALEGPLWLACAGLVLVVVGAVWRLLGDGDLATLAGLSLASGALADLGIAIGAGLLAAAVARPAAERPWRLAEAASAIAAGFGFVLISNVLLATVYDGVSASLPGSLIPGLYVVSAGALALVAAAATAGFAFREPRPRWAGAVAARGRGEILGAALVTAAAASVLIGLGEAMLSSTLTTLGYDGQIAVAAWVNVGARLLEALAFGVAARAFGTATRATRETNP